MELSQSNDHSPVRTAQGWAHLRRFTDARIALGRSGGSQTTPSVLDFRIAHARAKDAVYAEFDVPEIMEGLRGLGLGLGVFELKSAAGSRKEYLVRPDLGRRLSAASRDWLLEASGQWGARDLAVIISDGLAAMAAQRHGVGTVEAVCGSLLGSGWTIYPILVVPFGRVKIQDEIGAILKAKLTLMLLGERPGLGAPDSLGAYFTYRPAHDRTDADRNCVSNIRAEGLPPQSAGKKIAALMMKAVEHGGGGAQLKDEGETLLPAENP